jgi:putative ABC transport system permease protein
MKARSYIGRHFRYAGFVWLTLGAGLAIALVAAALWRVRLVWPVAIQPVVRPAAIPDTTWVHPWTAYSWSAAQTQQAGTAALMGVLLALAAAATAMALINVLTLGSARSIGRRRERAVRAALGSGPRQFLVERLRESLYVHGIAMLIAIAGAAAFGFFVKATWPQGLDPFEQPAFATAAGVLVVAFSMLALRTLYRRGPRDLRGALAGGSATEDRSAGTGRGITVAVEVALAMALASVTVLLLRHGGAGREPDTEDRSAIVTLDLTPPPAEPAERAELYGTLLDRLHELPGVEAESIASPGAWLGMGTRDRVLAECEACVRAGMLMPLVPAYPVHHSVSAGFFESFGIGLVEGRLFDRGDAWDTTRVAIINQSFAVATGFGRGGPIGKKVQVGGTDGEWFTIVGIVSDAPARGLGAPRRYAPALYLSAMQQPPAIIGLAARTDDEPVAFAENLRTIEPLATAMVGEPLSLDDRIERAVAPLRWFGTLFAVLAFVAFGFAVHGVLAAVRWSTNARRRELAVRAAVGAGPLRILGHVIGRTTRTVTIGLGIGLVLAALAGRTIQLQVGGMPPVDVPTVGPIAAVIATAALIGALGPALRAAGASPARVFRE